MEKLGVHSAAEITHLLMEANMGPWDWAPA
jgi:hypothetical protein